MLDSPEKCKHGIDPMSCALCAPQRNLADIYPTITENDAQEFFEAVEAAMRALTTSELQNLYLGSSSRLAVSFNGAWVPFLGFTKGYNYPEVRAPIRRNTKVLEQVRRWLVQMNRRVPGGRAFLTNSWVYCDDQLIGIWDWLGEDPAITVRNIHNLLLRC